MTLSPFSAHQSDKAPKMVCAALLMTFHTFSRKSFMIFHALSMVCRALSAPIPALSKIVPMRLLSPFIKATKS